MLGRRKFDLDAAWTTVLVAPKRAARVVRLPAGVGSFAFRDFRARPRSALLGRVRDFRSSPVTRSSTVFGRRGRSRTVFFGRRRSPSFYRTVFGRRRSPYCFWSSPVPYCVGRFWSSPVTVLVLVVAGQVLFFFGRLARTVFARFPRSSYRHRPFPAPVPVPARRNWSSRVSAPLAGRRRSLRPSPDRFLP